MNRRLSDAQIQATLRELLSRDPAAGMRAARAALRTRWGCSGRTDRILLHWRSERAASGATSAGEAGVFAPLQQALADAREQVRRAEEGRAAAEARAERAEHREMAHQDRWANEVYELREALRGVQAASSRCRALERRVLELERERVVLRAQLARQDRYQGAEAPAETSMRAGEDTLGDAERTPEG